MHAYGQNGAGGAGGGNGPTLGDYANGVPNIRISQIPASFMRQIPWMLPAILICIAASWFFTRDIKREYTADGRVLVQLGSEYVYNPAGAPNANNGGLMITPDQVVLTEIDIIKNSEVMDMVINQMIGDPVYGGERFAPDLYEKWVNAPGNEKIDRWNDIVKFVDKSYVVMPKPKSSIVNLVYKHEDGEVAVKTLDAFMNGYLNFRKDIFVAEASGQVAERRAATEEQLNQVESRIQSILNRNGISDFTTEQVGVQKRAEDLRAQLNALRGNLVAAETALATTEDQLRVTPETINLQVDDRASQRLAQAELERRQLLAKYLPTSNPVRAKEAEIAEIRNQINANGGEPQGGRRVGPNTVYQALATQRNTFQSQADSLREQEIILQRQLDSAIAKVKTLRELGPVYTSLVREKATLEERLKGLNAKEQEALVDKQQQEASSENIKVVTWPSLPRKGRNMQKIMFALASLASIFTVFMLALLRVFLDPRLYGPGPAARLQTHGHGAYGGGGGYDTYNDPIPEPVSIPSTYTDPAPAHAPAHAPAAAQAAQMADQGASQGGWPGAYVQPAYEHKAYANADTGYDTFSYDGDAQTAQMSGAYDGGPGGAAMMSGQYYADGTYAGDNPYASGVAMVAPQPMEQPAKNAQNFAGPEGDIPVLGQAGQSGSNNPAPQ